MPTPSEHEVPVDISEHTRALGAQASGEEQAFSQCQEFLLTVEGKRALFLIELEWSPNTAPGRCSIVRAAARGPSLATFRAHGLRPVYPPTWSS